jgi:hypothetical protein
MAAIYGFLKQVLIEKQLSSTLYPIESDESINVDTVFIIGHTWFWEDFEFDMSTRFVGGNMQQVRRFGAFEVYGGQIDTDTAFIDGSMEQVRRFGAFEVDGGQLDTNTVLTGGSMSIVVNYIQFTAEPDEIDTDTAFISGSLTPV